MAVGLTVISGAFSTSATDRAKIITFLGVNAKTSGAFIFMLPEVNNDKVWVGVTDTGQH